MSDDEELPPVLPPGLHYGPAVWSADDLQYRVENGLMTEAQRKTYIGDRDKFSSRTLAVAGKESEILDELYEVNRFNNNMQDAPDPIFDRTVFAAETFNSLSEIIPRNMHRSFTDDSDTPPDDCVALSMMDYIQNNGFDYTVTRCDELLKKVRSFYKDDLMALNMSLGAAFSGVDGRSTVQVVESFTETADYFHEILHCKRYLNALSPDKSAEERSYSLITAGAACVNHEVLQTNDTKARMRELKTIIMVKNTLMSQEFDNMPNLRDHLIETAKMLARVYARQLNPKAEKIDTKSPEFEAACAHHATKLVKPYMAQLIPLVKIELLWENPAKVTEALQKSVGLEPFKTTALELLSDIEKLFRMNGNKLDVFVSSEEDVGEAEDDANEAEEEEEEAGKEEDKASDDDKTPQWSDAENASGVAGSGGIEFHDGDRVRVKVRGIEWVAKIIRTEKPEADGTQKYKVQREGIMGTAVVQRMDIEGRAASPEENSAGRMKRMISRWGFPNVGRMKRKAELIAEPKAVKAAPAGKAINAAPAGKARKAEHVWVQFGSTVGRIIGTEVKCAEVVTRGAHKKKNGVLVDEQTAWLPQLDRDTPCKLVKCRNVSVYVPTTAITPYEKKKGKAKRGKKGGRRIKRRRVEKDSGSDDSEAKCDDGDESEDEVGEADKVEGEEEDEAEEEEKDDNDDDDESDDE